MYTENEIIAVAGRENNNKRSYLIVNRFQAKHIPVNPKKALEMFKALASKVRTDRNKKPLIIGFAETATAIGASAAIYLDTFFIQTTREQVENADFLYFSEEHSHATEQKIDSRSIEAYQDRISEIIFAEDEVTTGRTILNAVKIIRDKFGSNLKFSVMSVINGMDKAALALFRKENIDVYYILKTDNSKFEKQAENISHNGTVYKKTESPDKINPVYITEKYINTRRITDGFSYDNACRYFAGKICMEIKPQSGEKILVAGTEEFMYPAIFTAEVISESGAEVYCHSTTRSPIAVNIQPDYPLNSRFELLSFYDEKRITYIYNLKKYDKVIVVTDSQSGYEKGIQTLISALKIVGNKDISIFVWKEK